MKKCSFNDITRELKFTITKLWKFFDGHQIIHLDKGIFIWFKDMPWMTPSPYKTQPLENEFLSVCCGLSRMKKGRISYMSRTIHALMIMIERLLFWLHLCTTSLSSAHGQPLFLEMLQQNDLNIRQRVLQMLFLVVRKGFSL